MSGSRLVLASIVCFLVPLLLALCGAAVCRFSPTAQLAGATAGLLVGMAAWRFTGRMFAVSEEAA